MREVKKLWLLYDSECNVDKKTVVKNFFWGYLIQFWLYEVAKSM